MVNLRDGGGARKPLSVAVVMAAPFPALYGSQVLVRQLSEGLARRGHDVHLVAYGASSEALPSSVSVHRISRPWGCRIATSGPHPGKIILDFLLAKKLFAVVRRAEVDVIHAHNYEGAIVSLLVGRLLGRPVVYHGHSAMADELPTYFSTRASRATARRVGRWLDANVPRRADYCIGVTDDLVDLLCARGVRPSDVRCVLPGTPDLELEPSDALGLNGTGVSGAATGATLVYAGNLDGYQNLEFLLRSFARVRAARPDTRLQLVTHERGRRCRRRARLLADAGVTVRTVRNFPEVRLMIGAADVVVCPRTEATGFPMKLLNYMAAGKAIVACEGSAKMLEQDKTALVVPNGDEAAFAEAILALLDSPETRRRIGLGAREAVAAVYGWQRMVDGVEAIYGRVLADRAKRGGQGSCASPEAPR